MRGQDEGIKTDKGMHSSAAEEGKMVPTETGRAVRGPEESRGVLSGTGGGGLGEMARALCNHPDVHMAHYLLYKLYAKSTAVSMGSKKLGN